MQRELTPVLTADSYIAAVSVSHDFRSADDMSCQDVSRSEVERPWRGDPAEIIVGSVGPSTNIIAAVTGLEPWRDLAACAGHPVEMFFPARGASQDHALQICGRCKVREDCLAEALADPDLDFGIRGGMSARARKARRSLDKKRGGC
jgi:WhiB family redox-sensing transcriptional regulator